MRLDQYSYGPVAGFYDWLAAFYSRGRISVTKREHLAAIKGGERVLYAGIGQYEHRNLQPTVITMDEMTL